MSVRYSSAIWESGRFEGGMLLVALALADYANEQGECWPRVSSIAGKVRLTPRQTHNILRKLEAAGFLLAIQPGGGRSKSTRYRLNLETLKPVSVNSNSVKPISLKSEAETLKSATQNTEIYDIAIRKNRQEPYEPSKEQKPPYPLSSKGDLTKRDVRRLSKELDRIYGASVGANFDSSFEDRALRTACARLLIPLDQARAAVDASCGAAKISGGCFHLSETKNLEGILIPEVRG